MPTHQPEYLYCCTATWTADRDKSNPGALKFYTSIKALKEHEDCWQECGIIRIKAEAHSKAVRGSDSVVAAITTQRRDDLRK